MSEHYINYFKPPFGLLLLESTEDVLLRVQWVKNQDIPETETRPILDETKKQLQELMKKMMPMERMAGRMRGTTMERRRVRWLVFSRAATSMRERGMPFMYCRRRKMPVASASCGRATPKMLSTRPIFERVM